MSLVIEMSFADMNGKHTLGMISTVCESAHPKLPHHSYYEYHALVDGEVYSGRVLHNYNNGAIALTQKVSKAIMNKMKVDKQ